MAASLKNVRFLVVEDSPHMARIVRQVLRGLDANFVSEAATGADAIKVLHDQPVDIVILDLKLGSENGLDVLKAIRRDARSTVKYVPVIVLTAHSEWGLVTAARDAGATEFCQKPITIAELTRKLGAVIDTPRDFVEAPDYLGPERRRRAAAGFQGSDRRRQPV